MVYIYGYVLHSLFFTTLNRTGAIIIKGVIDKEYQTSYSLEVAWLSENGIRYTYVKVQDGVTVWKYKKTSKLFDALSEFYRNRGGSID